MVLSTMDNGQKMDIEMVEGHRFGKMEVSLLVTGETTKRTVKEDLFMLTEMSMKVTGLTIKLKEEELMNTWMVQNM